MPSIFYAGEAIRKIRMKDSENCQISSDSPVNLTLERSLRMEISSLIRILKVLMDEKNSFEKALHDDSKPGHPKKYGDTETAEIIALACSSPPEGRKRWTVRLIVEEMKKKEGFEGINRESVRLILKKTKLNHGKEECGASGP